MDRSSNDHTRPNVNAGQRLSTTILRHLSVFAGVENSEMQATKWSNRQKAFAEQLGTLKPEYSVNKTMDDTAASQSINLFKRPSVAAMTFNGLTNAVPQASMDPRSISASKLDSSKRLVGMGVLGRMFGRRVQRAAFTRHVKAQLDDFTDQRPFFTYWVTCVQILVYVVATIVYGVAPFGVGWSTVRRVVSLPSKARQVMKYTEPRSIWIGPRQEDLIRLGARYSPCMRRDPTLQALIDEDRRLENKSACCVRNDGAGCVQLVEYFCDILSTWKKWSPNNTGRGGRISGSVCGQDPSFCTKPASAEPYKWPDSIVDWPLCLETRKPDPKSVGKGDRHMACELLGRPCCFGIKGECWITTNEHCDLIRGHFHFDKYLCSQTECLQQTCGMIPFGNSKKPDQLYRLFTSIFLHAGLLHLLVTIIFQMWIMRDIEKLTGPVRLSIIYIGSGIFGNLASCTFIPHHLDAGPSGSQFGVIACLVVEVLQSYQMYSRPHSAILKTALLPFTLFVFGLLPWFDNWAHLFGFVFGFFLALAVLPYVSFGEFDRRRKIMTIVICLGISIAGLSVLLLIFYIAPLTECKFCKYLNCIPFTRDFCENMDVSVKQRYSYVSTFG